MLAPAYIGTAGWSYADWEGVVYPRRKPPGFHPLSYLARFVDCMELNSSFYRFPLAEHAQRWVECVSAVPRFAFIAKLHQTFTHAAPRSTAEMERDVALWRGGIAPLDEAQRLRGVLAQFPHSTVNRPQAWGRIEWIARQFGDLRVVLELRHESWFSAEALGRLRDLDVSVAHIDLPFAPTHPPENSTADPVGELGYLRLHGRNSEAWFDPKAGRDQRYDWLYSRSDVAAIVERARELARQYRETYVIANNHFAGKALANALEIRGELESARPLAPAGLVRAYPRLAEKVEIAVDEPGGQKELFE